MILITLGVELQTKEMSFYVIGSSRLYTNNLLSSCEYSLLYLNFSAQLLLSLSLSHTHRNILGLLAVLMIKQFVFGTGSQELVFG